MRTVIIIYEEIPETSRVFILRHISEDEYYKVLSFNNIFVGREWHPHMELTKEEYAKKEKEIADYFFKDDVFLFENEEIETPIMNINVDAVIRTGYLLT